MADERRCVERRFVSVDDISGWLAGYARPPKYATEHVLTTKLVPGGSTADLYTEAWRHHIEELIGNGLCQGVTVVVYNADDYYKGDGTACVNLSEDPS